MTARRTLSASVLSVEIRWVEELQPDIHHQHLTEESMLALTHAPVRQRRNTEDDREGVLVPRIS